MNWRMRKLVVNGSHLLLALAIILAALNLTPGGRALGFVVCGAVSGALLLTQMRRLLKGYYDRMRRLEVYIPVAVGITLGMMALVLEPSSDTGRVGFLEVLFWIGIHARYWLMRHRFVRVGDGFLPWATWLNVPANAIQEGDLLLMSGRISRMTKNSVGHVELVVRKDGKLVTITAYIEKGIVLFKTVRALCKQYSKEGGGHYIVLRPRSGFSAYQNQLCIEFAERMLGENKLKVEQCTPKVKARIDFFLPNWLCRAPLLNRFLPGLKTRLQAKWQPTGYDPISMRVGTHRDGLWTCHWIVLKTLEHAGVPVEAHESGLLGLGTGFLNPPYPVSLMADRHFRLLTLADKLQFETNNIVDGA
jgi:hypothetical protein